jgi:1,4-dihydroxy-2-naphthoate polyprenyltransferase
LPILGAYFVHTGEYTAMAWVAAVPSGLLVHNLLLINELPDVEADKTVKRRTLPIIAGKKFAAGFYSAFLILTYLWIIAWVIAGVMPVWTLLGLLTLPLAFKASSGAFRFNDMKKLGPALATDVLVVLLTQLLLAIGFILAGAL